MAKKKEVYTKYRSFKKKQGTTDGKVQLGAIHESAGEIVREKGIGKTA